MHRAREECIRGARFLKAGTLLLQCPNQSGIDWAQMGHRGADPMGTLCPLHPISSLSHGGFSPGREARHKEEERQGYRRGPTLVGAKEQEPQSMSVHAFQGTHTHTPCPAVHSSLDFPTIGSATNGHMCVWGVGGIGGRFQREAECDVTDRLEKTNCITSDA